MLERGIPKQQRAAVLPQLRSSGLCSAVSSPLLAGRKVAMVGKTASWSGSQAGDGARRAACGTPRS
jgi:hypothetical protein